MKEDGDRVIQRVLAIALEAGLSQPAVKPELKSKIEALVEDYKRYAQGELSEDELSARRTDAMELLFERIGQHTPERLLMALRALTCAYRKSEKEALSILVRARPRIEGKLEETLSHVAAFFFVLRGETDEEGNDVLDDGMQPLPQESDSGLQQAPEGDSGEPDWGDGGDF